MTSVGVMASAVVTSAVTDVLMEPFNNYTFAPWTLTSSPTIVAGRTGTAARLGDSGGTANITYAIPSAAQSDTVTIGLAYRTTNLGSTREVVNLRSDSAATDHNSLRVTSTGALTVFRVSASLGTTAAGVILINTWYYAELQIKLADSPNGYAKVRLNGVEVINVAGIDTRNLGTKTVYDTVRLIGIPSATNHQLFDDLYLTTGAGAPFKGDITIP